MTTARKLRFGLMCNSHRLMVWQAECLELLRSSNLTELKLVITPSDWPRTAKRSLLTRITAHPNGEILPVFCSRRRCHGARLRSGFYFAVWLRHYSRGDFAVCAIWRVVLSSR